MQTLMNRRIGWVAAWAALLFFLAPLAAAEERQEALSQPEAAGVRLLMDGDYLPALLEAIGQARVEIVLSAFFFRTTGAAQGLPDRVLAALEAAAGRGVRVTAILERGPEGDNVSRDNTATAERLHNRGVRVCLDPPERTTHAKLVVIDSRLLFVGSHNLTQSALRHNREVSVRIDSPRLAGEALRYLGGICH